MKVQRFPLQSRGDVVRKCTALANAYSTLYECQHIEKDMGYSLETFEEIALEYGKLGMPYYLAIRKQGTEGGTKSYVMERCEALGEPVAVLKIEDDIDGRFLLSVKQ